MRLEDAAETEAHVLHALQRLDVKPGDIVLAKLGDPHVGWIPSPEHEGHVLELLTAVLPEGARVMVYNYGLELRTLRDLGAPRRLSALEALAVVCVRNTPMHQVLAALSGDGLTEEALATATQLSPYQVTNLLGSARPATWITETEGRYALTELGREVLAAIG